LAEKNSRGPIRGRGAPVQLFEQILVQKEMCNEMLQSKNQLIEMLEAENRVCDENYKDLIHSYHVNMSVLAGRMENHVQVSNTRKKYYDELHIFLLTKCKEFCCSSLFTTLCGCFKTVTTPRSRLANEYL
jgi:hypothetical protein